MERPKYLLSDWSGVWSDDRKMVHHANNLILARFGHTPLDFDIWLSQTKGTLHEFLRTQGINVADPNEVASMHKETLQAAMKAGFHPTAYPDGQQLLSALQELNIPITVISSHPTGILIDEADRYEIRKNFTQFRGGITNKAEEIVRVSKELRIPLSQLAYLGDMESDGQAANRARVPFIAITTGYHTLDKLEKQNPVVVASSLTELAQIFRQTVRP